MKLLSYLNIEDFYKNIQNYSNNSFFNKIIHKKIAYYKSHENKIKYLCFKLYLPAYLFLIYKTRVKKLILGNTFYDYAKDVYVNKDEYCKLYNLLEDDESKQTLLNILLYKVSYDRDYLDINVRPMQDQYLDSQIMKFNEEEVIADCGAFIGDTAISYYKYMKKAKKYYLIEPDSNNIQHSKQILSKENFKNIEYIQCATGSENIESYFESGTQGGACLKSSFNSKSQHLLNYSFLKYDFTLKYSCLKYDSYPKYSWIFY